MLIENFKKAEVIIIYCIYNLLIVNNFLFFNDLFITFYLKYYENYLTAIFVMHLCKRSSSIYVFVRIRFGAVHLAYVQNTRILRINVKIWYVLLLIK